MVHCVPSLPVVPFHRRRTRSHRDFTSGDRGNEPARGSAGVSGGQRAERRRRRRAQPTRTAVVESGRSAVSRVLSAVCVCRVPSTTCRLPCLVCRQPSIEPREGRKSPLEATGRSPSWDKIGSCSEPFGAIAAKLLSSIRTNIFSVLPTLLDARLHFCVHTQTMTPEDARDGTARPRRSSRAVAKPDFRAMENYGDLTSEYGDDLFVARDPSPSHASRSAPHHARRPSGGSGGSGGRGMKKVGGGNVTKGGGGGRRPPVVEEMEQHAKKLEQDVAALQARRREVRGQLEAVLRENEKLRSELNAGKGEGGGNTKREQDDVGGIKSAGGGLLY